jgi:hypothetical protein
MPRCKKGEAPRSDHSTGPEEEPEVLCPDTEETERPETEVVRVPETLFPDEYRMSATAQFLGNLEEESQESLESQESPCMVKVGDENYC